MVDEYCEGCYYRAFFPALGWGCEYLVMTEKRRPCPSGAGCTVKLVKDRVGTKNAEHRKTILAVEAMTDEEKEARRQRQKLTNCINCGAPLKEKICPYCGTEYTGSGSITADIEKKRQKNREYYAAHKQKQQPGKRSIGAHDRKKITAERTRAFWKGRQTAAIKAWKLEHGLTYEQMAELLEVEPSTILMWVYENNTANWDKLRKIGIEKPFIPPQDN